MRTTGGAPKDTINLAACRETCAALPDPGAHGLGAAVHPDPAVAQ